VSLIHRRHGTHLCRFGRDRLWFKKMGRMMMMKKIG